MDIVLQAAQHVTPDTIRFTAMAFSAMIMLAVAGLLICQDRRP